MPSSLDAGVFHLFISLTMQDKIQILPVITYTWDFLWYWATYEKKKKKKERKFVSKFQNFIFQQKKNVA